MVSAVLEKFENPGVDDEMKADFLDETEWANQFDWDELHSAAKYTRYFELPAKTQIFAEGDMDAYLVLIIKGSIDIVKRDDAGKHKVLSTLSKGKALGEMALLDQSPRSAAAICATDCRILIMEQSQFKQLCDKTPALAVKILIRIAAMMSLRLRQTSGQLVDRLD